MKRDAVLWTVVLAGPTLWFASMLANFALAPWGCALGWRPAQYAVAAAALLLTAAAGFTAYRMWRQAGLEMPGESGGAVARRRSLSLAGVALSGLFVVVIVAQALPQVILGACE